MSRASSDFTDHVNKGGGTISDEAQPEKCHVARVEDAKAFLEALGFTVTPAETTK